MDEVLFIHTKLFSDFFSIGKKGLFIFKIHPYISKF